MSEQRNSRKTRTGYIVSDKMDKTVVVEIVRRTIHPKYKKIIKQSAKVKAHDEKNEYRTGDLVAIMETRPLSADKRWRVVKLLERNELDDSAGK